MKKNLIKEIIIVLLLLLAIILILGVLLYEYVPTNIIIPQPVSYTTPETVKNELSTGEDVDSSEVVVTYEVNEDDLKNYKKVKDYVSGKKNPFESITTDNTVTNGTTGNTSQAGTTSGTSSSSSSNSNQTSGQTTNSQVDNSDDTTGYLPDKGTK